MKKEDMLIIGAGGCGNRQLDVLMGLDVRYSGLFLNSNLTEMESLEHFSRERRCFYIPNADGCGKDMLKMEQFAKEEAPKFVVLVEKFTQDYILFLTSANGGTGAMATIMYAKLIKSRFPTKSINIVATYPSISESEIDFENATDFWNAMVNLKNKNVIDSIQYIDNDRANETEVNEKAMKELNASFSIVNGKLDTSDSRKVHSTKGYKVFLALDESIRDTKEAIDSAIKNSAFYMPDNFDCDKMIGDINVKNFQIRTVKDEFEYYDFSKFNENSDGKTNVLLGGCDMPKVAIELIREALKELKNKKRRRVVEEDLVIKRKSQDGKQTKEEVAPTKMSSDDLNNMFKDDSFWND